MKNIRLFIKMLVVFILMLIFLIDFMPTVSLGATVSQQVKSGIENFPKSYQDKLLALKELHPNWNFEAYYTGIDWNELIKNETGMTLHRRSVVPAYSSDLWKCKECEKSNGWTCASEEIVKYFIDPRNFLNEVNIFQFEELSFNKKVHTLASVKTSVKNTFLANSVTYYDEEQKKNVTRTYSDIIMEVAEKTNISPFHIKSKIIQEVGAQGSASVSGTYPGYENYYNFFNYGAHDTGDPVANGLEFAKEKGWNTPYKAILGGAQLIGSAYIEQGQNTSYFFKFDVVGDRILKAGEPVYTVNDTSFYRHQYMTNIMDPYSQSSSVYNMYAQNGNLEANLNFIIPVYENMGTQYNKKPTKYTAKDGDLYYTDVIKTAGVRDNPKFDSPVTYSLQKDEVVVMVSRKCILSDGVYWDIVTLENGWNVYVESNVMKLYQEKQRDEQQETIVLDEKNKTIKVTPTVKVSQIVEKVKASNYSIVDASGKTLAKDKETIATGYKINILKSDKKTVEKTYTLIKMGDVTGDGKVIAVDALAILKHSTKTKKLEGVYLQAADVKKNGKILAVNALLVLKYSIGTANINL